MLLMQHPYVAIGRLILNKLKDKPAKPPCKIAVLSLTSVIVCSVITLHIYNGSERRLLYLTLGFKVINCDALQDNTFAITQVKISVLHQAGISSVI